MTRAEGHIRPRTSKKQSKQNCPARSPEYFFTKDGIGAIPRPAGVPRAAFGLVVKGDCLHPRVHDGQILIVEKGSPKPGELACVWAEGFGLPQVKIFRRRIRGSGIELEQLNPPRLIQIRNGELNRIMRVHSVVEVPR